MPFPWKKMKKAKISQLVTDHLDSQRRLSGAPLVVETGFPASLVDIFVKNSRRLKKPSKMRKKESDSLILKSRSPSPAVEFPSSSLPTSLPSTLSCNIDVVEEKGGEPSTLSSNIDVVEEKGGEIVKELKGEGENFKGVLLAILGIFFVVVLALGTKKFAVGLTMSAFFFFFMEYVGINVYGLLSPCYEAKKRLRLMIKRVPRIGGKELEEEDTGFEVLQQGQQEGINSDCSDFRDHISISPICEIEIIEQPKRFLVPFLEDIQCQEDEESSKFGSDGKLKVRGSESEMVVLEKEEECICEVLELKKRKSRKAKMKSKMKRLFGRKSRSAKYVIISEEQESKHENDIKSRSDLSSISSGSYQVDEEISIGVVIREEEEEIPNKGNSGYLLLCLIVLLGLFGGRISALMFILSWCFLTKVSGNLRRCFTWPVVRFFGLNV